MENACKFGKPGETTVIQVGAQGDNADRTFFVRDNGVGFDMNFAPKLFQPFERLHNDPKITGSGIGLASVKRIVERHGGAVWAEGELNKGASFFFTL